MPNNNNDSDNGAFLQPPPPQQQQQQQKRKFAVDWNSAMQSCIASPEDIRKVDYDSLLKDKQFIDTLLKEQPRALAFLPRSIQSPELVNKTLPAYFRTASCSRNEEEHRQLAVHLDPSFWQGNGGESGMKVAWFRAGGLYVDDIFPVEWRKEKQIFLWIAEFASLDICLASYQHAHYYVVNDEDFMFQAVQLQRALIEKASFRLRRKFKLTLVTFAMYGDQLETMVNWYRNTYKGGAYLRRFISQVQRELTNHDGRFCDIMAAMSSSSSRHPPPPPPPPPFDNNKLNTADERQKKKTKKKKWALLQRRRQQRPAPPPKPCVLSILNQGRDTYIGFKDLIASFLGLPSDHDIHLRRKALSNLEPFRPALGTPLGGFRD